MSMTDAIFIYITHPELDGASLLARGLVEKRLAACANIIPGVRTVYRWHGKVEDDTETVVFSARSRLT